MVIEKYARPNIDDIVDGSVVTMITAVGNRECEIDFKLTRSKFGKYSIDSDVTVQGGFICDGYHASGFDSVQQVINYMAMGGWVLTKIK